MAKHSVRCTAFDRRGLQCGRNVTDGSQPPLCHIHAGKKNPGVPFKSAITDPEEVIRRLMTDPDSKVRLRAADIYYEIQKEKLKTCPECLRREETMRALGIPEDVMLRMTPDQLDEYTFYLSFIKALRDKAATQLLYEDVLRMNGQLLPGAVALPEAARPVPIVKVEKPPVESEPATFRLPQEHWASCGIEVGAHGEPNHALGDTHAENIVNGTIPLAEAQATQQLVIKRLNKMAGKTRPAGELP